MTGTTAFVAILSLVAVLVTTPLCIALARRFDITDHAGPLKPQAEAVPYLGGLAVFTGLALGIAPHRPSSLIALAGALVVGLADDRWDLAPGLRLVAEVAIGFCIVLTQPVHVAGWLGVPLIVGGTVLLINGVNLLDGLDTLAAGVTAVAALGFAWLLTGTSRLIAVSLMASLVGFLWFNRPPARIYLGDGGSYLLGTGLALLLTTAWAPGVSTATGLIVLSLVAIPVAELACAIVRRFRSRQALTAGDRQHPYDQLVARGWPRIAASGAYVGMELIVAVVVVLVASRSTVWALVVDGLVGTLVLIAAAFAGGMSPTQVAAS